MNMELIRDALNAALQEIERHALDSDSGDRAHELVLEALKETENGTEQTGNCGAKRCDGCGDGHCGD